jgi:prepilin peptidase CpaA
MAGGCTLPAIFAPKRLPEDISVLFQAIVLLLGICLFVVAGYGDVKTLNIPNVLVAAVAVLGFIRLIQIGDLTTALYTTGAAALLFTVSIVLFARDIVGGGDVKLLTSAIFLIGYQDLFPFLFLMSISGLLVSILVLVIHRIRPTTTRVVPYGVAIATAGIVMLLFQPSLFG